VVLKHTQLDCFVTVAETGQMTRAARILQIGQPALSQAISQLETQLGVKLLERHPRGVTLTPAGSIFLEKARIALDAQAAAAATAAALARDLRGAIQIGFLSIPPTLLVPGLLEAFGRAHPQVVLSSRELRFPTAATARWLSDVDVALCHAPLPDPEVEILTLRRDPRVVLMRDDHHLAGRAELRVTDVLEETFCGCHPSVDPAYRAFWNLDEDRGSPPSAVTSDRAGNTLELVAAMTSGSAITTLAAPVAAVIIDLVPNLLALPLLDAEPAGCALVWHVSRRSSLTADLVELARATSGSPAALRPVGGDGNGVAGRAAALSRRAPVGPPG
jgi:DNA-binding transcriptional LysR family regulator